MSTRLERYVFPALVALALWAAVLVAVPAAAQAQAAVKKDEDARGADRGAAARGAGANLAREVVRPGDSLWSISAEVLRPNATPRQIAAGAERIYALNREQIGPNPNVIFAGQRLSVPSRGSEPSTSGRSAGTQPAAHEAAEAASDEAASGSELAGRQSKRGTVEAPSQAAAPEPAPLPDAARAAPVPAARQNVVEEPPRPPGESFSFVGEARAAVAGAASAIVGLFPSGEGHEGHAWRELLGAALLAVSSVAFVLALLLALALAVAAPKRARRSQQEGWWGEVRANGRAHEGAREGAYERASFDPSPHEELANGTTGARARTNGSHANGAHTNGNVPVGMKEGAPPPSRPSGTGVGGR